MTQAERDRLEEARIARARAEREAQLSGSTAQVRWRVWEVFSRLINDRLVKCLKLSAIVLKRIALPAPVPSVRLNCLVVAPVMYEMR